MVSVSRLLLVLENDLANIEEMRQQLAGAGLKKSVTFIDNSPDCILWLSRNLLRCGLISLDYDLGPFRENDPESFDPGTGRDVAHYLAERAPVCPVVIHTDNFFIRPGIQEILDNGNWRHHSVSPGNGITWIRTEWLPAVKQYFS